MKKKERTSSVAIRIDEERRTLIRAKMTSPEWKGVERGVYEVTLSLPGASGTEIHLHEAVLVRQIDRLLQRVVDQNRSALVELCLTEESRPLLERAWTALEPVRSVASCDGEYRMTFPGEVVVGFTITEWDSALLQRYDDLLQRVYEDNRGAIEAALGVRRRPGIARCDELSPKARRPGDDEVSEAA